MHDITCMALAGLLGLTGSRSAPLPGVADDASALHAAVADLAACMRHEITGERCFIDVALSESLFSRFSFHLLTYMAEGVEPVPGESEFTGRYPLLRALCDEGRRLGLICGSGREVPEQLLQGRREAGSRKWTIRCERCRKEVVAAHFRLAHPCRVGGPRRRARPLPRAGTEYRRGPLAPAVPRRGACSSTPHRGRGVAPGDVARPL